MSSDVTTPKLLAVITNAGAVSFDLPTIREVYVQAFLNEIVPRDHELRESLCQLRIDKKIKILRRATSSGLLLVPITGGDS